MDIDKEIKELLIIIKEKRTEKGISQQEIANFLGVTQGAYAKLENGATDLKLKTLYLIAEYLQIDINANKSSTNLVAINPNDIVSDISNIKNEQNSLKKAQDKMNQNQDDMNQKLDEILEFFKKKNK
jgi:transcriptional regulator with XRE-family HTH domain